MGVVYQIKDLDSTTSHYTLYLPTLRACIFLIIICGQKGYGNYYERQIAGPDPKDGCRRDVG